MKDQIRKLWKSNRSFFIFIICMTVFRTSIADWNEVPTGSMQPTIVEGDRLWINKLAYDVKFPFSQISILKIADPLRGDIIIFESEKADKRLVKRVIGMPGDIVKMTNNILTINDRALTYRSLLKRSEEYEEDLLGLKHNIKIDHNRQFFSSFEPVTVPSGHYLVLGDNRDNSADSRVIGFVPRGEIIGRSRNVVLSLNYNNYYIPRSNRYLHDLDDN